MSEIILASASPRRRAFLEGAGVSIAVRPADIDETPRTAEGPVEFARRMAAEKAAAVVGARATGDATWVLASDTVVTADGAILGKPEGPDDACDMLRRLSGRAHQVVTAWALASAEETRVGHAATAVRFRALNDAEVDAYVATGEPLDKAGAYGIQGGAGAFVEGIDGPYDVVVGLPLDAVLDALVDVGAVAFPSDIAARAALIRGRVAAVAGHPVRLVGVSKRQSVEAMRAAVAAGVVDLGESYVQEWREKVPQVAGARWHFVGGLQRNKAKFLGAEVSLVHSVDSVRLGAALGNAARQHTRTIDVLVQVNLAGEQTKSGVAPDEVPALLDALDGIEGVRPRGLMTLPPNAGPVAARARFFELRRLRDALSTADRALPELSMGMSGDYEQAVAAGATLIRVGTALFGPRRGV